MSRPSHSSYHQTYIKFFAVCFGLHIVILISRNILDPWYQMWIKTVGVGVGVRVGGWLVSCGTAPNRLSTYLLHRYITYLLHGADYFLRS
jgi:hypothetical protein